jgi:LacI family transcriptional regulator
VPEDVAVVGFDGSAVAVALDPPLTSVRQPFEQLGTEAMDLLLSVVGGVDAPVGRRVLTPSLVVRSSTG